MAGKTIKKPNINSFNDEEIERWFESEDEIAVEKSVSNEEKLTAKYSESQLRIVRTTMDFSLHNLKQSLEDSSYINLKPAYQRRNRWDIIHQSRLIESFLMNIPVPPIFLYENNYNQYEIMDGRQRLEAIKGYLNNIYPLKGLEFWRELDSLRFNELPLTLQKGLLRRTLSAIVLLAETTKPEHIEVEDLSIDVRMVLFQRLNTGGVKLNPQELRNALYPGSFSKILINASRSDLFTRIWGIPKKTTDEDEDPPKELLNNTLYKTMADCELVLRFFAIRETIIKGLKGPLRLLLDRCMERHKNDSDEIAVAHEKIFLECLTILDDIFDRKPFILPKSNRPSRPLYDALMVALSLKLNENIIDNLKQKNKEIKSRLATCLKIPEAYDILIGRGNTIESIKERIKLASAILFGKD